MVKFNEHFGVTESVLKSEYEENRNRNNLSVRKSRERSKLKIQQTKEKINRLRIENESLTSEMTQMTKELVYLKKLFNSYFVKKNGNDVGVDATELFLHLKGQTWRK